MVAKGEIKYTIADENLDRTTADKTSSVHFLRFELSADQANAMQAGAALYAGIDHDAYKIDRFEVDQSIRDSLAGDLDSGGLH